MDMLTTYRLDNWDSIPAKAEIFLFGTMSRTNFQVHSVSYTNVYQECFPMGYVARTSS
jgi:hypothetical protein